MPRRKPRVLKLATYNVNGIGPRLPHLLAWLERKADKLYARKQRYGDAV